MLMMFFHFLKIIFDISTSKRSKKYKPHSILTKKKILKFNETQLQTQCQPVRSFSVQIINLTMSRDLLRYSTVKSRNKTYSGRVQR
jgi:hypothetical protein